jgi:serine/threonine protein kinase
LKAVSKGYIVQTGMKESISNEKNILTMTNSPFIIKLFECYNSDQNIYFLLEPALGGELYATYNRRGFHGKEAHAKYYTAGVVYAFEHCHVRHIIYRDLKPENLLLTAEGKVKLTDMGLAKFVVGTSFTTCGTPDYFAPELISSEGHTVAVDWWTLGILIYELMGGNPPFESDNPMQAYQKVVKGIDQVNFHKKCLGVVENLIKSLLRQKPAERIPMRPGGIKNVMDHEWYKDFDWKAMQQGSLEPPYKPTVKSKTDMKNFHARAEDKPPQIPYKDDGTGWDKDFATSV